MAVTACGFSSNPDTRLGTPLVLVNCEHDWRHSRLKQLFRRSPAADTFTLKVVLFPSLFSDTTIKYCAAALPQSSTIALTFVSFSSSSSASASLLISPIRLSTSLFLFLWIFSYLAHLILWFCVSSRNLIRTIANSNSNVSRIESDSLVGRHVFCFVANFRSICRRPAIKKLHTKPIFCWTNV